MRALCCVLWLCCIFAVPLFAKGREQLYFAGQMNLKKHHFDALAQEFSTVDTTYGGRLDYLREVSRNIWFGLGYSRANGSKNSTEGNVEFADFIMERYYGNRHLIAEKGRVWQKFSFRIGARGGLYRWMVQRKKSGVLTELNYGPTYYSFGWSVAPYWAVGIGTLGSLEYAYRLHFSGGADTSRLNNTYLSYVYNLEF